MKLLFCEECFDIVAPLPSPYSPRYCRCRAHAVWWTEPLRGILRLYESKGEWDPPAEGQDPNYHAWARKRSPHKAYVIGLHNSFLNYPKGHSAETIKGILERTPSSYIFKTWNTLVIRIRPGESNDTDWSENLP